MGEQTTLTVATTGKESLRTTVPISIIKNFKLKAGDKLDWNFDVKDGKMIIVVHPVRIEDKKIIP
ncbi:MAG TPA: AbrB family transcriptional regulator [Candidatus Bathyarchaeia archaeon]|nr:AbrB family transcriptional regulator [Candidatus Bathyarchaeia archaeon]